MGHQTGNEGGRQGCGAILGTDTEQDPVGLLGTKPLCVPHFFDDRKQALFSLHDPP